MMAIVQDLAGLEVPGRSPGGVDVPLCSVNRTRSSTPQGALTPLYRAERVQDTTSGLVYRAVTLANNSWTQDYYDNGR